MKLQSFIAPFAAIALFALGDVGVARADESPERVSLDLRIGPYDPDGDRSTFDQYFSDDHGPLLEFDAFFHIYRIPYVGPIGITAAGGWARYSGIACLDTDCTVRSGETVRLDLFPVGALATLRFDAPWHEWHVPVFVQGGVGAEWVRFRSSKGGVRDGYGSAFGFRWQAQLGLYLDAFERRAARSLDVEHGINHSYIFFELRGSTASDSIPIADRFTWAGGLGLVF